MKEKIFFSKKYRSTTMTIILIVVRQSRQKTLINLKSPDLQVHVNLRKTYWYIYNMCDIFMGYYNEVNLDFFGSPW